MTLFADSVSDPIFGQVMLHLKKAGLWMAGGLLHLQGYDQLVQETFLPVERQNACRVLSTILAQYETGDIGFETVLHRLEEWLRIRLHNRHTAHETRRKTGNPVPKKLFSCMKSFLSSSTWRG